MDSLHNNPGSSNADSRLLKIAALVKQGDAQAFEELYRLTYKYAYFHAKSILHDDDEAWDLVQETYIAVYQHIDSLREERYVKSWISGIIFNLGMKRLRKKRDLLLDEDKDFLFEAVEDGSIGISPEKALDSKETSAIVREVIDQLPALQKAAVIAYYFDEKTVAVIAEEAMCSENTIKSRLNYARKAMKDSIQKKERQMGVKLHAVTGPIIVFVLRDMFNSMIVSGQKARYTWIGIRKSLGLAGLAAQAAGAGTAGGAGNTTAAASEGAGSSTATGAAGSPGNAVPASASEGAGSSAATTAAGSPGNAAAAAASEGAGSAAATGVVGNIAATGISGSAAATAAAAGTVSAAGAAGKAGAASLLFGAVKVKTAVIILTACLATGGAAGVAIGKGMIASGHRTSAEKAYGDQGSPAPTDAADVLPAATGASMKASDPADTSDPAVDMSDGWKTLENGRGYVENGAYIRHAWKEIEGELYYFDRNGRMADQDISLGRQTFSFDTDGHLTGIRAADSGTECTVYCDEDIRYSLDNGRLLRESPEDGKQTIYEGANPLISFTISDNTAFCFSAETLLLIDVTDGSILNDYSVASLGISAPLSICLSDSALYLSTLDSDGAEGYLTEFTNLVSPPNGYGSDSSKDYKWKNVNYASGYSPEFYKLQAANEAIYYLRSNRYPTVSGVQSSGYKLCRGSNSQSTVLMDENIDEFFIYNDTLYYMANSALKKKSLSQMAAATADRNQKALAAYRERLTEYAKIPVETGSDQPSSPTSFNVVDLNQDGVFEVLVERGNYFATSYCELLYYTDHLEQADLSQSCRTVDEENGLIISSYCHQNFDCTVYHFDGTGVTQVASIILSPEISVYESESAAVDEVNRGLADLKRWEFGAGELTGLELSETAFDLAFSGDGARSGSVPSSLWAFAQDFLSPVLSPSEEPAE
ncbi:MAG: sigma-70 family RNA polymerase sigma factor [Clostridium sp.]|nr:sigma-70 family RNA polymerase sigma factor [Clostridium sp.]